MNAGISAINEEVKNASTFVQPLLGGMSKVDIGQKILVERLIIGLLANGHVLLEGTANEVFSNSEVQNAYLGSQYR